jgi:copper(I)-binding protein
MIPRGSVVLMALAAAGCAGDVGPPLEVSDISIYAPLPGSTMSVGYMTLTNNSRDAVEITSIQSPGFAAVELHETQVTDGVARMTALGALTVPARSSVTLREGGKHLMLMSPRQPVELGQPVTLEIRYAGDGLVIVNATVQPRFTVVQPQ